MKEVVHTYDHTAPGLTSLRELFHFFIRIAFISSGINFSFVGHCEFLYHDDIAIVVLIEDSNFNMSTKILNPCRLEAV